jgi:hypothetical protein
MKYRHHFQVSAPLACASNFHSQAASMPTITPPPLSVRLHHAPDVLSEGDEMDFSLGIGPLSMVVDEITLRLRTEPLWRVIGFGMWVGLPFLFAFRSYKTKRILQ